MEVAVEVNHARTVDVVAEKLLLIAVADFFYRSFYISIVDAALGVESFGKSAHHVSRVPAVFRFASNLEVKHRDITRMIFIVSLERTEVVFLQFVTGG